MVSNVLETGEQDLYYRQMLESITEYEVIRLDEKGTVCSWHPGAEKLTQYSADEIIGQPVTTFYTEEDVNNGLVDTELKTAAETGRYETEGLRVRKDGTLFWVTVSLTPIRDPDGTVSGFVKVARDMTEARRQAWALRSIEQMMDSIADYEVIRIDENGVIESWNPGARRLKQYTVEEAVGHHVSLFYPEDDVRAGVPDPRPGTPRGSA
jgi:rsbT co-antagonist protein RsbR